MNKYAPRTMLRVSDALKGTAQPTRTLIRRSRFRLALLSGLGAILVLIVGSSLHGLHRHGLSGHLIFGIPPAAFLLLAITSVRATAAELDVLLRWRGGHNAGAAIRMMVTVTGYLIAVLGALGMLSVPIGHLLLGGAIAGVIIGIAAQQSLGNVFAGMVLLMARPFVVGNRIRVRSGALGGEFSGTVVAMSLTYVSISTTDGLLKVPNSSILASAVGPWHPPEGAGAPDQPAT